MENVSGILCRNNRKLVIIKRDTEHQSERGKAREYSCCDYIQSESLLLLSLTLPSLKLLFSLLLYHLLPFQRDRRWQSSIKSSLIHSPAIDYASGTVVLEAGRLSHSCSESLSKPPTPPPSQKILCSPCNTSSPSVTTATALESTIYIRHSSHLPIKTRLNCQSIILHCKLPTHLLLRTFPYSATELGSTDIHPSHTHTH